MPSQRVIYGDDDEHPRMLPEESLRKVLEMVAPFRHQLDLELRDGIEELIDDGYLKERAEVLEALSKKVECHDVFICHSSVDKRFARRLANDLIENHFKVWFDEFEMLPGDSLYDKIQSAIKNSAWFIIVLSADSVESKWCKRELHNALEQEFDRKRVYVVPVLHRQCEIPGFLQEKIWADCSSGRYRKGLLQVLRRLSK